VVTDPSGAAGFEVEPTPFAETLRMALAEDPEAPERATGVRLVTEEIRRIPPSGPLESVQSAELIPADAPAGVPDCDLIERVGDAYWRFLSRRFLGLVRAVGGRDERAVVLLGRPLVLLRFRRQRYRPLPAGGELRWPIAGGWLVSRTGRDQGVLSLRIERRTPQRGSPATLLVTMRVSGYFPSLRGNGRLARVGTRLYAETQAHLHRVITRSFLRSLGAARR
jgi:hypothetical protein